MRKRFIAVFLDFVLLLFIGLILLILSTGGFSFSLGTLSVTAHSLKNPTIGLIIILLLRKIVTGKFFQGVFLLTPFKNRLIASRRFRILVCGFPLFLLLIIGLLKAVNPLQHGLTANYYDNVEGSEAPIMTARERALNLSRMPSEYPDIISNYSIRWTGVMHISQAGKYEFVTISDDGSQLYIDKQLVVDNWGFHTVQKRKGRVRLEKGFYPIEIRYMQGYDRAWFEVYWRRTDAKNRKILSCDVLYLKEPTDTEFFVGRGLEIVVILCTFLLLSSLLIGLSSCPLLFSLLKTSIIGKVFLKCRSWLFKEDVVKQAIPVSAKASPVPFLIAIVSYALLSLVWTYPLIANFSTKIFGWGGDRYIYLWNMWWMKKALLNLHINPLYTDYLFYPKGISLAFHDFSLLLNSISLPLQHIFTLEEIYNILYLSSYALGGGGCFLLMRYLTGDNLAAFFSGVVFAFWGGRAYYTDHLYLASIQWIPYCALYLLKTLRETSYRNPVLAAVFFTFNALTSWVYAIYMVIFAGIFLLYSAWADRKRTIAAACMRRIGLIGILFLLLMSPVVYPMITHILAGQHYMNAPVLPTLSASPNTVFLPSVNHGILGKYMTTLYLKAGFPVPRDLTGGAFIGYTVLLLCVYTWYKLKHLKPKFWMFAALFFLLLSFGPRLQIFSRHYSWVPLPYLILERIPILKTVRVPERFMIMVMLCCSVLAGYACWDLFRRTRFRKGIFSTLMILILFEFFRVYTINPVEPTPNFYKKLGQDPEPYAVLELTRLTELEHAARRSSLFQITHEKKLFNGFVARVSPDTYHQAYRLYRILDDVLMQPMKFLDRSAPSILQVDKKTLISILSYYNVRYIALYHDYKRRDFQNNKTRLSRLFGQPLAKERGIYLFHVDNVPVTEDIVFPGYGMFPLPVDDYGPWYRQASRKAEIWVLNVKGHEKLQIQFEGQSTVSPEEIHVQIFVNDQLITTANIGDWEEVALPPVDITPGENTITFLMPDIEAKDWWVGIYLRRILVELL